MIDKIKEILAIRNAAEDTHAGPREEQIDEDQLVIAKGRSVNASAIERAEAMEALRRKLDALGEELEADIRD